MKKFLRYSFFGFLTVFLVLGGYFFVGSAEPAEKITWGVNFSQKQAESLGFNWKEIYSALLEDLKVRNLKLATYWDLLEKEKGEYNFDDLDWQIGKAKDYGAKVFLVIGMKTPRWPECHIPEWAKGLSKEAQQERILGLLEEIVIRYRGATPVWAWQVENEPFFPFGECSWSDKDFLKKEIALVKSLDNRNRPVVISDSGEFSFWITAAALGDEVGATLHRKVWFKELNRYVQYPIPPIFYWRKAQIIDKFFLKHLWLPYHLTS